MSLGYLENLDEETPYSENLLDIIEGAGSTITQVTNPTVLVSNAVIAFSKVVEY